MYVNNKDYTYLFLLILDTQELFCSKIIELQIRNFLQTSNTLFLHFIVIYFRKIQFLSFYFYSIFSKHKKKKKRKTNKMPPILLIFSSLFWKTGRYLEKSKRRKFACVLSRYLDGRYDYQTDARSGTFVSSFLVSLDIFDLLKRRIERRISNGREQCI